MQPTLDLAQQCQHPVQLLPSASSLPKTLSKRSFLCAKPLPLLFLDDITDVVSLPAGLNGQGPHLVNGVTAEATEASVAREKNAHTPDGVGLCRQGGMLVGTGSHTLTSNDLPRGRLLVVPCTGIVRRVPIRRARARIRVAVELVEGKLIERARQAMAGSEVAI